MKEYIRGGLINVDSCSLFSSTIWREADIRELISLDEHIRRVLEIDTYAFAIPRDIWEYILSHWSGREVCEVVPDQMDNSTYLWIFKLVSL